MPERYVPVSWLPLLHSMPQHGGEAYSSPSLCSFNELSHLNFSTHLSEHLVEDIGLVQPSLGWFCGMLFRIWVRGRESRTLSLTHTHTHTHQCFEQSWNQRDLHCCTERWMNSREKRLATRCHGQICLYRQMSCLAWCYKLFECHWSLWLTKCFLGLAPSGLYSCLFTA
jgi:hypothetical protein